MTQQIKNIKDLGENEVIQSKTETEAIAICKLMHEAGKTWRDGRSMLDHHNWEVHKEKTCYYPFGCMYNGLDYSNENSDTIHPASSFLPESFYQVEPKVGQLWECVKTIGHFQVGDTGTLEISAHTSLITVSKSPGKWTKVTPETLREFFKFHSNPETMIDVNQPSGPIEPAASPIHDEPTSERKRESFRFYDQLPPELARQARENFDEGYNPDFPLTVADAIAFGWAWYKSKHGDVNSWAVVFQDAEKGKYNISEASSADDFTFSMKDLSKESNIKIYNKEALIDLYSKLDDNGKKVMRETYPNVEFPKVKEYVTGVDYIGNDFLKHTSSGNDMKKEFVILFSNCTPEIVGNEIRFVKN